MNSLLPRPSSSLLFWFAVVVLPFATLAPLVPGGFPVAALAIGAFAAVVLFDAVSAGRQNLGIRVEVPPLVRLQKNRPGALQVVVRREQASLQNLRMAFDWPEKLGPETLEQTIMLRKGELDVRAEWPCTPLARGKYELRQIALETPSPLGFWAARASQECQCEVRVYPDLFGERKQVSAVFLRRGNLGAHAHRQAGQGREFEKLRAYLPGDSLGDIHWKASAKRGEAVTKVYQIERSHEVYVAIDASRLSARRLDEKGSALERYVSAALVLALAAEQQGDQFGLITFSDRVHQALRASSGQAHFNACRESLYTLEPRSVSPDFEELATYVRTHLRKRALLVILTALDDPVLAEGFSKAAELMSRQHLVLVNMLQPGGVRPLFSEPEAGRNVEEVYRELSGHLQWHALRELQNALKRRGVRFSLLDPARLSADLVAQHADVRARQLV